MFAPLIIVLLMSLEEVIVKVTLSCECLRATFELTKVGFFASVQPKMSLKITFFIEGLLAVLERTNKVACAIMFL